MSKKYIPDKSWLTCDKGQLPTQITVTHDNNSKLYGEKMVSEADMVPGENIKPFGRCSVTGGPCKFDPLYWDKCNQGVKVNSFKMVFEDANLICKAGGKIKVDFTVPQGSYFDFGFTGLGLTAQWANYKGAIDYNQRGVIYDVQHDKVSLTTDNGNHARKGNYGEMNDNVYHRENDWRDIRKEHPVIDIDKPTASGIDGAYEKGGVMKATDGKYGTARIEETVRNGKELSESWVENHLNRGAITSPADEQAMRTANQNGTLQREVIYTDKNEKGVIREGLSSETHDATGAKETRGQFETLNMKPRSMAGKMIDATRSSMRNSKPIKALAGSNFAKGVQESTAAVRANKALWKGAQFMESTPALRTTGKVVGRGLIVVGIAIDAAFIYSAYNEEGGFGDKTQQATGSAIGGTAGAWAGAEIGAVIGTAICPGVGTVIGGIVGGVIGGLAGSSAGSKIVDWLF
ncbi:PAAR-like protein [Chitinophaga sancti]|uniref:PAAR-like protein n=1 Tax=Chitinophaga sancti TaxID=1004 RepID=A0A1K1SG08_9BACT|nr:PAAR-like protein [Chitinophaga sancti]WQD59862.1 PAAR-like protein [Chitinophaga sancti]WQG88007.1 PAAR-like protein [Chitinophaga sancti]SFW83320.1 protein of unknown function [Chitinophaga sancti]